IQDSNDGQFSECNTRGMRPDSQSETATATPKANVLAGVALPSRSAYSSSAAPHKPLNIRDKMAADVNRCTNVATLALSLRAARAFSVSGEVDGFLSESGAVWTVNTVVHVTIAALQIDEPMWILSREFVQDKPGGQRTRLTLIPLGALTLGDLAS